MTDQQSRPARKQVDAPVTGYEQSNDMSTFNIWDGRKRSGARPPREGRGVKNRSEYRCRPAADVGWTRGEKANVGYQCLYFARGICHHGADCNFLHRLPTAADEDRLRRQPQYDIFGRDRLDEESRTKGAGSISRESKTLYIYLGGAATVSEDLLRESITEGFGEWGPLDDVRVIPSKAIAFVRYVWRASAEFAKAAMHQQTLKKIAAEHVLDVRWANDDPNPKAKARVKREHEETAAAAYLNALAAADPETKKARLHELALTAGYRPGGVASAYPDTSEQYEGWDARAAAEAAAGGRGEAGTAAEAAQDAAIREYEAAIWGTKGREGWRRVQGGLEGPAAVGSGGGEEGEDDIERYLPPDDDDEALVYDEEWAQPEEGEGKAPEEKKKEVAAAAEDSGGGKEEAGDVDALGLIGGYGSDCE